MHMCDRASSHALRPARHMINRASSSSNGTKKRKRNSKKKNPFLPPESPSHRLATRSAKRMFPGVQRLSTPRCARCLRVNLFPAPAGKSRWVYLLAVVERVRCSFPCRKASALRVQRPAACNSVRKKARLELLRR